MITKILQLICCNAHGLRVNRSRPRNGRRNLFAVNVRRNGSGKFDGNAMTSHNGKFAGKGSNNYL
jgi:hypothetical protein